MRQHTKNIGANEKCAVTLSTADIPAWCRRDWLCEVIGREYANVDITPPTKDTLFNEMNILPWQDLRLSIIHSNAITIQRLPQEPYWASQDCYFGVILLAGEYMLEQNGREVFLQAGDMTLYDATRPHRVYCPKSFSKLIITIPRKLLHTRIAGVEHCTAMRIAGKQGIGAVTANFIRSTAQQWNTIPTETFDTLADNALDLLTLALNSVRPQNYTLSRSRSLSLHRVKDFVEHHLANPSLDSTMVSAGTGLSVRYINDLFQDQANSLMRHVWQRRLDHCQQDILNPMLKGQRISQIAMRWGFNDLSHFSRTFKKKFGIAPREIRL